VRVATLLLNAAGTSLSDMSGNLIPIATLTNGQITISTLALLLITAAASLICRCPKQC
jgi:hypothetical protein